MKNLLKAFFVLTATFAFFSCASTSLPAWVDDPQSDYPSTVYISAVGSGKTRENAEKSAKVALCQVLGEKISSEQNTFQSENSYGETYASIDVSTTEQVLVEKIVGIKIEKTFSSKGDSGTEYYALAVLKKSEAVLYYSQKISSLDSEISTLISKAQGAQGTLRSIAMMNRALSLAEENEYNIEILSSIQGMRTGVSYGNVQNVRAKRATIDEGVRVFVNVAGDDSGRILSAFQEAVTNAGLTLARTGDFGYMLTAEISFEELDGTNLPDSNKYKYIRATISSSLASVDEKTVILPFDWSGREGHLSVQQAKFRAIQKITDEIAENYSEQLKDAMEKF